MSEVKKVSKAKQNYYFALGRRKSSVATVRLSNGNGKIIVNSQDYNNYFNNKTLEHTIIKPLELVGKTKTLDISIRAKGGGKVGQAQAISLAISRALNLLSDDLRPSLKKAGMLTRNPRVKERKKYGLKKARKAPQFSKR